MSNHVSSKTDHLRLLTRVTTTNFIALKLLVGKTVLRFHSPTVSAVALVSAKVRNKTLFQLLSNKFANKTQHHLSSLQSTPATRLTSPTPPPVSIQSPDSLPKATPLPSLNRWTRSRSALVLPKSSMETSRLSRSDSSTQRRRKVRGGGSREGVYSGVR